MLLTRLKKFTSGKADCTEASIGQMFERVPKAFIKTLTLDNDMGFANHRSIGRTLDTDVYFTAYIPPSIKVALRT